MVSDQEHVTSCLPACLPVRYSCMLHALLHVCVLVMD